MDSLSTNNVKKRVFSGIQPTGVFTLGNYLGALKNWTLLQQSCQCIYCVVNMHAITVRQNPTELYENTLSSLALLMACGVNIDESILFVQSDVSQHAELSWILNCYTPYGELSRMTQFKDKSQKYEDNINAGLFTYPVLMAADILLYNADLVPVGEDQRQHLELARDIAVRFNGIYGEVMKVPAPYMPSTNAGARVMSLQTPTKKMSKSDVNPKGYISMLDTPDTIVKKIKSAVTDSDGKICYAEGKDGVNNLLRILSAINGQSMEQLENHFQGCGYGKLKQEVAEAVVAELEPIQNSYSEIIKNRDFLTKISRNGAERAAEIAVATLNTIKKCIGFSM